MRKEDLSRAIANQLGLPSNEVTPVLEAFMWNVKNEIRNGGQVYLRGFGTFKPIIRKAKVGRNITAGISMALPAKRVAKFKPSKYFMH